MILTHIFIIKNIILDICHVAVNFCLVLECIYIKKEESTAK